MPHPPAPTSGLTSTARSLADDVRQRSDAELATLLRLRPDLARPAPSDLTSLAARASTRASVQRALDGLDRAHLQVLEAAAVLGGTIGADEVADLLGTERSLEPYLGRLWDGALLWRGPGGLYVMRTVAEVLGPHVAGLGPSAAELRGSVAAELADPARLAGLIADAPPAARAILDRLAWGPAVAVLPADPGGAVAEGSRWLLVHQLVAASGADQITLPREVGLALRGGRLHRESALEPPSPSLTPYPQADVDRAAGSEVSQLLVLVDDLAAEWGPRPPRVLRAGGLAVRDLRRLATVLDVDTDQAAFVAEVAHAAALVADDGSLEPVWAPTPLFDEWQQLPGAARWAALATGWLSTTRAPHLVGTTPPGAGSAANALGPDVVWPPVRSLRADLLTELGRLEPGHAPSVAGVVELLRWRRPLRVPASIGDVAAAIVREAGWLGITGRGALSRAGRALITHAGQAELADTMQPHLPAPVEHVLLQADLTAIAPGPLEGGLAQFMRLIADIESRGGATVYRFTPDSVRRCLDTGWSVDQTLGALGDASHTPIPQPLEYLVRDVARRHGQTRVGSVASYLRSDDEATLTALLADRGLAPIQLRRIAPTVLVSPVEATTVLDFLRENSFAPVAESADGGVLVPSATPRRTPARRVPSAPVVQTVDDDAARTLVAALRAGEESAAYRREQRAAEPGPSLPSTDPTTALAVLREAAADRQGVWIGYSNGEGQVRRMLFYPERVEGGRVHGTADGATRTISIHRITGASTD